MKTITKLEILYKVTEDLYRKINKNNEEVRFCGQSTKYNL